MPIPYELLTNPMVTQPQNPLRVPPSPRPRVSLSPSPRLKQPHLPSLKLQLWLYVEHFGLNLVHR